MSSKEAGRDQMGFRCGASLEGQGARVKAHMMAISKSTLFQAILRSINV